MSAEQVSKLVEQLNSLRLSEELEEISGSQSNAINSEAVAIFQQWLVKDYKRQTKSESMFENLKGGVGSYLMAFSITIKGNKMR